MTTARSIVSGALTFHLNRLAPGETLDPDTGRLCLDALNAIVDEFNGGRTMLFREAITESSAITGESATLGVHWPTLAPGVKIIGATVSYSAGMDVPLGVMTMAEYLGIAIKSVASIPQKYAHDGLAAVYFYPAASGQTVKLLTRQAVANFADLDTEYTMPPGYMGWLQALLAKKLAPGMGGVTVDISNAARGAKLSIIAANCNPAIIEGVGAPGNILAGWR